MNQITDAIKHIIIINVIVFIAPQILQSDFTNILALHFPKNEHFGFWQYVTHMFMHGGFTHLLFNMYGLWAFVIAAIALGARRRSRQNQAAEVKPAAILDQGDG